MKKIAKSVLFVRDCISNVLNISVRTDLNTMESSRNIQI